MLLASRLYVVRLLSLVLAAFLTPNRPIECSSAMKRLYEDLFTDYNRLILPVANNETKLTVTLGLKLGQILDLNLKQQILSTNVWVEQTWHDYKLQWEPALYEGIDMIHVPAENIWIPDIVLFNNADGNYELTLVAKARLYSNGTVVWKPPTVFRSTCEIDVEYFPFDIQTCFLRFGSWTYAGDEVQLRPVGNGRKVDIGIDLSQFYKNVEWDIIDVPAYYNEVYYDCCTEPFPDVTFKIVIRRKMLFHLVNLILPVALMTFMTVSVFYLPSDSNEKLTLSISILTSLIVFFLLMLEIIPASSLAVPLFGKYLLFTLALVSLSACLSVYVLNIHHRSPSVHSMSPRVRKIFLDTLPRLLRLNRPDPRERSSLNRFRKKKIAQQMLHQSANQAASNKVYDLAQPLAASLNLIETLHKSYDFNPRDDDPLSSSASLDDEGRYFRKYVDNYISRLKEVKQKPASAENARNGLAANCNCESRRTKSCCEHSKCCGRANQPWPTKQTVAAGRNHILGSGCCGVGGAMSNVDWTGSSADMIRPLVNGNRMASFEESSAAASCNNCSNRSRSHHQAASACAYANGGPRPPTSVGRMLNDDTLDMTFDYDYDQDGGGRRGSVAARQSQLPAAAPDDEELPSPPPPPRQLAQLSDSMQNKSGRVSSCSRNITSNSSLDQNDDSRLTNEQLEDHACLVDKLINSIHLINNASDEIDTTTLSNDNDTSTSDEPKPTVGAFDHLSAHFGRGGSVSGGGDKFSASQPSRQQQHQHQMQMQMQLRKRQLLSSMGAQQSSSHGRPHEASPLLGILHHNNTGTGGSVDGEAAPTCCTCPPQPSSCGLHQAATEQQGPPKVGPDPVWAGQAAAAAGETKQPSELLMSLRLSYDQMPAHVRAAIRSILFIADTIKNADDENSAIEDWVSMSMVVDRLFLWVFFLLCTFGSIIILALAPSLYDQRASIDDKLRLDLPLSNCSAAPV